MNFSHVQYPAPTGQAERRTVARGAPRKGESPLRAVPLPNCPDGNHGETCFFPSALWKSKGVRHG